MEQISSIAKKLRKAAFVDAVLPMVFLYVVTVQLDNSVYYTNSLLVMVTKALRYAIYILGTTKLLLSLAEMATNRRSVNYIWGLLLGISAVVWLCSGNRVLLCYTLLGYYAKDTKLDSLIKVSFWGILLIFVGLLALSLLGLVPNWTFARGSSIRYSLGYNYPTAPSTVLFMIMLLYFYLSKGKPRVLTVILELIATIFIYTLTDSRMGLILSLLIVLLEVVALIYGRFKIGRNPRKSAWLVNATKRAIAYSPYIIFLAIVVALALYAFQTSVGYRLNVLLSDRLALTVAALKKYGITPFGQHIKWRGWAGVGYVQSSAFEYNYVDIAYMRLLFDCGAIFLGAYLYSYSKYLRSLLAAGQFVLLSCAVLILIWGMVEPNIIEVGRNPFVFSLIFYIVNDMRKGAHGKEIAY